MGMHMTTAAFRRAAIEAEIEAHLERVTMLLARIDQDDAPDEDLEDDDPAGDYLEMIGEASSDDGRRLLPTRPLWALDQSDGPVNHQQAQREYLAVEMGFVRSPTEGWRQA